ncbi:GAP family protein [Alkalicoccus daliensis]|uniref:Sap, sulfolipid-1-addressing protein n=1 Tax=Alkalicoccus daliensis TaxID=745820 RepID=A0A1H0JY57_9BACI|nr:GAP family protein [Alkalicoccus daliensis]SDO48685.1 Sap, sulfolipid-1-addressing protein [Alkalicoccus daliensis]
MLTLELVWTLTGLATLDALVTSTLYVVIVMLLTARRPAATSISYAFGALGSFFVLTMLLYFGSSYMAEMMNTFTFWVRSIVVFAAAGFFVYLGIKRFKSRPRHGMKLPGWVNPWTAFPFGILLMLMDIPFSFPMFLAVERLVELEITPQIASLTLFVYTLVSSLPTVLLIGVGLIFRRRAQNFLQRLLNRFTSGYAKASWRIAFIHFSLSAFCLSLLIVMIR